MGHPQHDLLNALLAGFLNRKIQQRNQALGTFQRKTFRSNKFLANELFKSDGVGQARQDTQLFLTRELQSIFGPLHPALQPAPRLQFVDVHVLHADRAAIRIAQPLQQRAQRERSFVGEGFAMDWTVHVRLGESEELRLELGGRGLGQTEWINLRNPVPTHAVEPNQQINPVLHPGNFCIGQVLGRGFRVNRGRIENAERPEGRTEARLGKAQFAVPKICKIALPIGGDGRGIAQVTLV